MQPRNPNTNQTTVNTHMSLQRGPTKIGHTSSACAACKYQRKKCNSDCLLAPYFPPTHQTQFLNAHKLFGVSNILKIIRSLNDPTEKEQAMRTMIIQANARANDPVGGCYRSVCDLQREIKLYQAELGFVLNQLAVYRAQAAAAVAAGEDNHHLHHENMIMNGPVVPSSNVYRNQISHQDLLQQIHDNQDEQQLQQQYYNMIEADNNNQVIHDDDDEAALNQLWNMETLEVNMMKPSLSSSILDDQKLQQQEQQESFTDPDVP